jgi:hypothetical protein
VVVVVVLLQPKTAKDTALKSLAVDFMGFLLFDWRSALVSQGVWRHHR